MKAKTLRTLREIAASLVAVAMLVPMFYPALPGYIREWYLCLLVIGIGLIALVAPKPIISSPISHE